MVKTTKNIIANYDQTLLLKNLKIYQNLPFQNSQKP
jgi:hypothetical protein